MVRFSNLLKRFQRDERGAFLVIFGILGLVLIATAGAVVDFTTIEQARTRAQDALDSAALGLQKTIYTDGVTEATLMVEAQDLLSERLNNDDITATVTGVAVTTATGSLRIDARLTIPTSFVALVGVSQVNASIASVVARGSVDLEVAVALDTTGSMGTPNPQKIVDLRAATNALIDIIVQDEQEPTTTRMALVPYSQAVNLGAAAVNARGAIQGPSTITAVAWANTAKNITGAAWQVAGTIRDINTITKATNAKVTTSAAHGYSSNQFVYIYGVSGMTGANNKVFTITNNTSTQFSLNANSNTWGNYSASGNDHSVRCETSTCEVVITVANHGFVAGDKVYIKSVGGMTQINNRVFTVGATTTNTFVLSGEVGTTYTAYSSGGTVQKCILTSCNMRVTVSAAPTRVLQANDNVRITSTSGITTTPAGCSSINAINNGNGGSCSNSSVWAVTPITTTTFSIPVYGPNTTGSYSSGGTAQCAMMLCDYYYVNLWSGSHAYFYPTNCVTERTGTDAFTETSPEDVLMGPNYRASGSPCIAQEVVPLTDDKVSLHATANALTASGSTGGHIGIAWAWYMLSPEFAFLWPEDRRPVAYADGPDDVIKVVIIMTDGAFNTVYRNGVVARNSLTPGSGGTSEKIDLDALNGSALVQGAAQCAAMKAPLTTPGAPTTDKVVVYTVGFDIAADANAQTLLNGCATDGDHAYLASNGAQLLAAFQDIANNISQLRVTQ